ncbi:MAG TPA: sugar kinase [Planctomycetaceae bacterium]|jgi:sugar/nucleoside kinase (ribokinase family)|nr:sugar kinase [Planctomycetaceae bacterium]|tara:strand:- start:7269 stop:8174 length:906 start_codon:yes stop_codon:yes gene_type:complete
MSLLVVGSIAFDSVETPTERRDNVIGGSATYFSYAASYFTKVNLVGVVGGDWPDAHTQLLEDRNVDTTGLVKVDSEKTFNWTGKYLPNMNDRETLDVNLNVFGTFDPVLPESYKSTPYVFLANGMPAIQMRVLDQVESPKLVVADTMDLWINEHRDSLLELLKRIDGLVLNDSEAKLLTGHENLISAAKAVLDLGVSFVVLKKGEHGALYVSADDMFVLPAYPTEAVKDPTGAGDSFAGGMMGYLASVDDTSAASIRRALVYGTLVASYNVEDFSLDKMREIEKSDLDIRFERFKSAVNFT